MAEARPAPLFIGDDLALDFLNSLGGSCGSQIEWLADGHDLLSWLEQAHAVPAEVIGRFRAIADRRALDEIAEQARGLREWFRGFAHRHAGQPLAPEAASELGLLNGLLEQDETYRQVGAGPRWKTMRRWRGPGSLLLPIAEAMGDLVCDKAFTLVRRCEGPACTLWFHDVSKAHARRWCSMALCGNRAKAAAHRARATAFPDYHAVARRNSGFAHQARKASIAAVPGLFLSRVSP